MMHATIPALVLLALRLMNTAPGICSRIFYGSIHPESVINPVLDPEEFNESEAGWTAVFYLLDRGVEDVCICQVMRIEAPVSAYLVDATGDMVSDEGDSYSVFRVGILDGRYNRECRGEEFVFLAGGVSETGEAILFPPIDPDSAFVVEHEFLGDEDYFLGLSERYPAEMQRPRLSGVL